MKWWPWRKKQAPQINTVVSVDEEGNIFCFAVRKKDKDLENHSGTTPELVRD